MALKPGTTAVGFEFAESMAEAMEQAFQEELPKVASLPKIPGKDLHLRLLFVAIAKGVVRHLASHPDAFRVQVQVSGVEAGAGEVTEIRTA